MSYLSRFCIILAYLPERFLFFVTCAVTSLTADFVSRFRSLALSIVIVLSRGETGSMF